MKKVNIKISIFFALALFCLISPIEIFAAEATQEHVCSQKLVCGLFCPDEGGTWGYIQMVYTLIRIAIPAAVIVLGMLDFAGVVLSGEEKDMKAAGHRFLKRIIIGIVFILLPFIIDFIVNVVGFSEDCLGKLR